MKTQIDKHKKFNKKKINDRDMEKWTTWDNNDKKSIYTIARGERYHVAKMGKILNNNFLPLILTIFLTVIGEFRKY